MKRPKPTTLPCPMWREIDGDGRVLEPWETAILLEAQERAAALVAPSGGLSPALQAVIANTVLTLARRSLTHDRELEAEALATLTAKTVLGATIEAPTANGHAASMAPEDYEISLRQ